MKLPYCPKCGTICVDFWSFGKPDIKKPEPILFGLNLLFWKEPKQYGCAECGWQGNDPVIQETDFAPRTIGRHEE